MMNNEKTKTGDRKKERGTDVLCYMDIVAKEAEEYGADHPSPMSAILEEIESYTLDSSPYLGMLTGRVEGRFLQLVVSLSGARNVVDIGTFTGYSALAMAEALAGEGKVVTIEHNSDNADTAQAYFDRSPHGEKISMHRGETSKVTCR